MGLDSLANRSSERLLAVAELDVRTLQFFMPLRFPSLPFCSVPVLVLWLSIFGIATVHSVFRPIFKSGLGCFSLIRFFPFTRSGRCFEQAGVKFEGLIRARVRRYFAAQPMPVAEVGEVASAFSLSVRDANPQIGRRSANLPRHSRRFTPRSGRATVDPVAGDG